ncbi:Ribonuclease H domain [Dillenia turbinata]|uniref:Ribonuclease H domain n=1 Tax=Dillenia turbinata TaxID=194707 RepID=A0AAN8ZWK7_9MAGN
MSGGSRERKKKMQIEFSKWKGSVADKGQQRRITNLRKGGMEKATHHGVLDMLERESERKNRADKGKEMVLKGRKFRIAVTGPHPKSLKMDLEKNNMDPGDDVVLSHEHNRIDYIAKRSLNATAKGHINFWTGDTINWLKAGVKGFSIDDSILDSSKFVAAIWIIWKVRCSRNIKNVRMLPMQVARWTISFSSEIKNAISRSPTRKETSEKWVCWSPPMGDNIKLNTDGSVSQSNGHAAARGILRNARGEWVAGFYINVGNCSVLATQIWGVREGLNLASRKGLRNIELEVDSTAVAMDVFIPEDYVIRRRLERRPAIAAAKRSISLPESEKKRSTAKAPTSFGLENEFLFPTSLRENIVFSCFSA